MTEAEKEFIRKNLERKTEAERLRLEKKNRKQQQDLQDELPEGIEPLNNNELGIVEQEKQNIKRILQQNEPEINKIVPLTEFDQIQLEIETRAQVNQRNEINGGVNGRILPRDITELPLSPIEESKLREKQIAFCKQYVKTGGMAVQSYMSVYKGVTKRAASGAASRLLAREDIRAQISAELLSVKSLERIDKSFVVSKLKDLALKCEEDGNNKYLIESLDMLSKLAGFYVNAAPPATINLNQTMHFGDFDPNPSNSNPTIHIQPNNSLNDILGEIQDEDDFLARQDIRSTYESNNAVKSSNPTTSSEGFDDNNDDEYL